MIIYDLKCRKNHEFEGWFKDRAAFEQQQEQALITCPVCGDAGAQMVPSLPSVRCRELKTPERRNEVLSPLMAMQQMSEFIEKNFEDVGETFAEVAIKIHDGEEEARNVKGTTTRQEEEMLREKGVPFFKIPVMKFDS